MKISNVDIARVCHETNRALQNVLGDPCPSEPWDALSAEARALSLYGVHQAQQGRSPEEMHQLWMSFMFEHGWKYGEKKNEVEKTHPNLVSFDHLSEDEQLKDKVFISIVSHLGQMSA